MRPTIPLLLAALASPAAAAPVHLVAYEQLLGMEVILDVPADDGPEVSDAKAPLPDLPPLDVTLPVPPLTCEGAPTGNPGVCWVAGPFSWIAAGRPVAHPGRGHLPGWPYCGRCRDVPRAPEPHPPVVVAPPGGTVTPVPVPAALPMLVAGIASLIAWRKL